MSRREEWQDPGKNSVQRPKHIRPATLQEKLERIQEEIKKIESKMKISRYEFPKSKSISYQDLYDHLKIRENALKMEIEKENAE